jgi:hypothetical protein
MTNYGCGSGFERVAGAFVNYLAATPLARKYQVGTYTSGCGGINGKPGYSIFIPTTVAAEAMPIDIPLQAWTGPNGQYADATSGWADPSSGAGVTTTAPPFNAGGGPTPCVLVGSSIVCGSATPTQSFQLNGFTADPTFQDPDTNAVRHWLDPNHWAKPTVSDDGAEFDGPGGPYFSMPDCVGLSVASCEAAVNDAIAATGAGYTGGFTVEPAPTYNPDVTVGAVVSTIAASSTSTDASSIVIEENETDPSDWCSSKTRNMHWSISGQTMVAKAIVNCPFTDAALPVTVAAWTCTSDPNPNTTVAGLEANSDCSYVVGPDARTMSVVANEWSNPTYIGSALSFTPNVWYCAAIWGAQVKESTSQCWKPQAPPVEGGSR